MTELPKIINNIHQISEQSLEKLISLFKIEQYVKGIIFIPQGRKNDKEYILIGGVCRSFVYSSEGSEITLSFYNQKSVLSPNMTRTQNYKSTLNIQALTEIKVASFSTVLFMNLMDNNPEIEAWGNLILQKELMRKVDKEISQASMNAKERLIHFRKKYQILENIISHAHIASYLGITTVSLSRLRKELVNKA